MSGPVVDRGRRNTEFARSWLADQIMKGHVRGEVQTAPDGRQVWTIVATPAVKRCVLGYREKP